MPQLTEKQQPIKCPPLKAPKLPQSTIQGSQKPHFNNYESIVGTSKYLSPELKEIHDNGDEGTLSKFNFFKSDVFSFGLVLLELAKLQLPKRTGNDEIYQIKINEMIEEVNIQYSNVEKKKFKELNELIEILKVCLTVDHEKRRDFFELFFIINFNNGVLMKKLVNGNNGFLIRKIVLLNEKNYQSNSK